MIQQILSYKTLFFNIVTTISSAFLPVINKSLHEALITICTSAGDPLLLLPLLKCTTCPSLGHIHWLVSIKFSKRQWVPFFPYAGTQWHTFASYTYPCQTLLCQTAPLLPSVTRQQHVMGYWWEGSISTAIPPTSTSDDVGQHHKTGDTLLLEQLSHKKG